MFLRLCLSVFLAVCLLPAQAFELEVKKVSARAYALVGDIGPRSVENHALNNTLGFLVSAQGVILIGSGATPDGAQLIEQTVAQVTEQPIRWLINIGAQDHHWLGNAYFAKKGIEIIALERTVAAQKKHVDNHLSRLKALLGAEAAAAVIPHYASKPLAADDAPLTLGDLTLRLFFPGNGHFSGDAVLWFAAEKVAFVGDFVFHDRILGLHPFSPLQEWRDSFHVIAALKPAQVVAGHGYPGDLAKAQRDTGHYLDWLVENMQQAVADWVELDAALAQFADAPDFQHLQFYENWHRRNLHQAYLQFEAAGQ